MIDLREHKSLIEHLTSEENEKDQNWSWSVKSVDKTKARIFWGYLEYCDQPEPYFIIELEDTGDGCWIYAKDEKGCTIKMEIVEDKEIPSLNVPIEDAIKKMMHSIISIAHNCY